MLGIALALLSGATWSRQVDIAGPDGSVRFGNSVHVLSNGNIVVSDPDGGPVPGAGAVHLYSPSGLRLSTLTGDSAEDHVGRQVTVLPTGHFVVVSAQWDSVNRFDAGAVTWIDGTTGLSGIVSADNSLIGTHNDDGVGSGGITVLTNGNYVVSSPDWNGNFNIRAGAVTWVDGNVGQVGAVSPDNSLVGAANDDRVGHVTALANGNFLVWAFGTNNGQQFDVGSVTWGNGTSGISGPVTSANSLLGASGSSPVRPPIALSNGNYVVPSPEFDLPNAANAGAVTWCNGSTGCSGTIAAGNALVGSTAEDRIGGGVHPLTNGNYVVTSPTWDDGSIVDAGAATWRDGTLPATGVVSASNSLVGASAGDAIADASAPVVALANGNYVVLSPSWTDALNATPENARLDAGAATWGNGATGTSGAVSSANSLVGSRDFDMVGLFGAVALANGNYVVLNRYWDNGMIEDAGAATWGDGTTGRVGEISSANSLVGVSPFDYVGAVTALANGNYVVSTPNWHGTGGTLDGASTWADGAVGGAGPVTSANSLLGGAGVLSAIALSTGDYVVVAPSYGFGSIIGAGAMTWADGTAGLVGSISTANSLHGSRNFDQVGVGRNSCSTSASDVLVQHHASWDNGAVPNAGAFTLAPATGLVGPVTADNSVVGLAANGGLDLTCAYDPSRNRLVVGQPFANAISLFSYPSERVFDDGFE